MLSIETKVRGKIINFTYVHNEKLIKNNTYEYYVEHHRVNLEPKIIEFKIQHKQDEGAEKLLLLIYKEISKRLTK
jgi:hypothetical protein